MHPNIFWSYLVAHRLKRPLSGLLYSSLSHGNKPVIVTAGQVYDALQLSSSFFSACLLIDVFTGGLSDGWLRRMSLVPRCITFLCLEDYLKSLHNLPYLYRGPGGVCVYVQVFSASVFDGLLEKQLCVCVWVRVRVQWLYTCYPDVQCDPTLLSLSCLKQFQMACGVQTNCRRKRPTELP